jgi:NAD(P)-dependent dehydrogenase (short-subunit alcohol dehydrogenase family)
VRPGTDLSDRIVPGRARQREEASAAPAAESPAGEAHEPRGAGRGDRLAEQLGGRVALITGGGRGLGEAVCRALADAGAVVIPADIREDLAEGVAAAIRGRGGRAAAYRLDVTSEDQAEATVRDVVSAFGRLDVLVNNAAIDLTVPVSELSVADWDRIMAVNLRGPFVMAKHALAQMARQGRGHVVNIVSTAAKRAWPNAAAYHASKWGLLGLSHALHAEARAQRIKVTAIVAGGMRTPFLLDRFPDIDPGVLQDPANVAETIRFVLEQPEETVIAEVTVLPMRETSWP